MPELKIYRAPDGSLWQYREGEQPKGYVLTTKRKIARTPRVATEDKQAYPLTKD